MALCSRHDQEVLLEGHEAELFKCLHHAPFWPWDVLLLQQGKGRWDVQAEQIPREYGVPQRSGQKTQPREIWYPSMVSSKYHVIIYNSYKLYFEKLNYWYRFDSTPESGETKGLLLILDAHSDLVTSSSVTEAYRVSHFYCLQYITGGVDMLISDLCRDLRQQLIQKMNILSQQEVQYC